MSSLESCLLAALSAQTWQPLRMFTHKSGQLTEATGVTRTIRRWIWALLVGNGQLLRIALALWAQYLQVRASGVDQSPPISLATRKLPTSYTRQGRSRSSRLTCKVGHQLGRESALLGHVLRVVKAIVTRSSCRSSILFYKRMAVSQVVVAGFPNYLMLSENIIINTNYIKTETNF